MCKKKNIEPKKVCWSAVKEAGRAPNRSRGYKDNKEKVPIRWLEDRKYNNRRGMSATEESAEKIMSTPWSRGARGPRGTHWKKEPKGERKARLERDGGTQTEKAV